MRDIVDLRYYECMLPLLDRTDRAGLVANVGVALAIVLIFNALIFGLGWQATSERATRFLPPPVVIGLVWVALFACMACARWELNRTMAARADKTVLLALFGLCATYPLYTGGLNNDLIGEIGNVTLFLLSGSLVARYIRRAPRATAWLVPLFAWLGFASVAGAFTLARAS